MGRARAGTDRPLVRGRPALVPDGRLVATGSRGPERAARLRGGVRGRGPRLLRGAGGRTPRSTSCTSPRRTRCTTSTRLALEAGQGGALREADDAGRGVDRAPCSPRPPARGLFLMEAMWMACNPVIRKLLRLLASGDYGAAAPGARRPRLRRRRRPDRPDARPGARRRCAARHGHLPADLGPPRAGRARAARRRSRTCPSPGSTSTSPSPGATPAVRPPPSRRR